MSNGVFVLTFWMLCY